MGSSYPLVALYTDAVPAKCLTALDARGIRRRKVPMLSPSNGRTYAEGARFNETWTKLVTFSLVEYDRVVLLDSDMLVRQNMDELMTLELDDPALEGKGSRVFAATHACACNPVKRAHYPANWYDQHYPSTLPVEDIRKKKKKTNPLSGNKDSRKLRVHVSTRRPGKCTISRTSGHIRGWDA